MRLCSFSFLCKWGKYCILYIIIDLFFPFDLICCVVFLNVTIMSYVAVLMLRDIFNLLMFQTTLCCHHHPHRERTGLSAAQGGYEEVGFLGPRTWLTVYCSALSCPPEKCTNSHTRVCHSLLRCSTPCRANRSFCQVRLWFVMYSQWLGDCNGYSGLLASASWTLWAECCRESPGPRPHTFPEV